MLPYSNVVWPPDVICYAPQEICELCDVCERIFKEEATVLELRGEVELIISFDCVIDHWRAVHSLCGLEWVEAIRPRRKEKYTRLSIHMRCRVRYST
jgi:hypothetical protein